MPKVKDKKKRDENDSDVEVDIQIDADDESSDSEEGFAEQLLAEGSLSAGEAKKLRKLIKLRDLARQEKLEEKRRKEEQKKKTHASDTLRRLEKKYGSIQHETSDSSSLPDTSTKKPVRKSPRNMKPRTYGQESDSAGEDEVRGPTPPLEDPVVNRPKEANKKRKRADTPKKKTSEKAQATSRSDATTIAKSSTSVAQRPRAQHGNAKTSGSRVRPYLVNDQDNSDDSGAPRGPPRGGPSAPSRGGQSATSRGGGSRTPSGTPRGRGRGSRTPRTPRGRANPTRRQGNRTPAGNQSFRVYWLTSESEPEGEADEYRNPNWEPEEIEAIYRTAADFRTEVLNEFSDNLLKEVREARKIRAFRAIQLAVNNACGNNRRATHILKKMRDFKYLTKKKNERISTQARDLGVLGRQSGGPPVDFDEQLTPEEVLALDFYGIEHCGAIPGAMIRPVASDSDDSESAYRAMAKGNSEQKKAIKTYNVRKKDEKRKQVQNYGYKPILMEVTPSVPTTPKQGMPPATPSRSSERLRARQEAGPSGSISDELDRLWSSGKNPRRELSFSRRDPKDDELASPLSRKVVTPPRKKKKTADDEDEIIVVDGTPGPATTESRRPAPDTPAVEDFDNFDQSPPGATPTTSSSHQPEPRQGNKSRHADAHTSKGKKSGSRNPQTPARGPAGRDGSNGDVPESSNKDGAKKKTAERPQKKPRTQPQEGGGPSPVTEKLDQVLTGQAGIAQRLTNVEERLAQESTLERKVDALCASTQVLQLQVLAVERSIPSKDTVEQLTACVRKMSNVEDMAALFQAARVSMDAMGTKFEELKTAVAAQGAKHSVVSGRLSTLEKVCSDLKSSVDEIDWSDQQPGQQHEQQPVEKRDAGSQTESVKVDVPPMKDNCNPDSLDGEKTISVNPIDVDIMNAACTLAEIASVEANEGEDKQADSAETNTVPNDKVEVPSPKKRPRTQFLHSEGPIEEAASTGIEEETSASVTTPKKTSKSLGPRKPKPKPNRRNQTKK